MRRTLLLVVPILWLAVSPAPAHAGPPVRAAADSTADARMLVRWAQGELADSSVEARQRAIRDLKEALRLDPRNVVAWRTLGHTYELGRFRGLARECYQRAIRLAPNEPDGFMDLAMAWKREWINTLDSTALRRAIAALDTAALLRPHAADPWLRLVPLRYERGDLAGAAEAAEQALAGRPRRPAALLAVAYLAFRRGEVERADSAFTAAFPRLDPTLRSLFEKPSWVGIGTGGPAAGARAGPPAGPWAGLDPDPTTPQNELQLEYWSRVAHAYFVFYDPLRPELDARAETYVRYGSPRRIDLNPLGAATVYQYHQTFGGRDRIMMEYPLDALVWSYPDLGMRVVLQDRSLTGSYTRAATRDFDPLSVPDPRVLAARGDLVSVGDGLAIFPTLPPRDQRLDLAGTVARFEGERGPRLLAQVQSPGEPGDTLWARWVVLDSTGREAARDARSLAVSACDPTERQVAEFSSELPAGAFRVAVSVRDAHHRRGLFRAVTVLAPPTRTLALSDVVLACGDLPTMLSGPTVRLEANIEARVKGNRPLIAYFEIYRLAAAADGLSRFEYEYTVRRDPEAPKGIMRLFVQPEPAIVTSASREEAHVGALRRQFVSVATHSLAPGRYRLEIRVRDLVAGTEARGEARFVRE